MEPMLVESIELVHEDRQPGPAPISGRASSGPPPTDGLERVPFVKPSNVRALSEPLVGARNPNHWPSRRSLPGSTNELGRTGPNGLVGRMSFDR
jgi:hypothetical protein